jgi:hypothetical protein
MDDWFFEDLEHDFANRWQTGIPDPLYAALRDRLGEHFKAALVHPMGGDEDVAAFLIVSEGGEEACLARFERPSTTTISFLGSLAGGEYTETVTLDEEGRQEVEGIFKHSGRIGDAPLRVTVSPPPSASAMRQFTRRARERSEQLLQQFRAWTAQPPRQAS